MIMVLIIAFCFWFADMLLKILEKVWEYQHFLTVKDGTPTLFFHLFYQSLRYFIDHDCHRYVTSFY